MTRDRHQISSTKIPEDKERCVHSQKWDTAKTNFISSPWCSGTTLTNWRPRINGGLWLHKYDGVCEIDRCTRKRYQASIYLYKVTYILFVQDDLTPLTTALEVLKISWHETIQIIWNPWNCCHLIVTDHISRHMICAKWFISNNLFEQSFTAICIWMHDFRSVSTCINTSRLEYYVHNHFRT